MLDIDIVNPDTNYIICPVSGTIVDTGLLKELLESFYETDRFIDELKIFKEDLKNYILEKVDLSSDSMTTYASSDKFRAKIVRKGTEWDKTKLKSLYKNSIAKRYLTIREVAPNMIEIKKLMKECSEDEEFNLIKNEIISCMRESRSLPSISIEPINQKLD